MPDFFSKWLEKEAYSHPGFLLSLILALAVSLGFFINPFVMAEDYQKFQATTQAELTEFKDKLQGIDRSICQLQYSSDTNALEQKITSVETEVYQLERLENGGDARPRDVERLDNQRATLQKLQRELQVLQRKGCQ